MWRILLAACMVWQVFLVDAWAAVRERRVIEARANEAYEQDARSMRPARAIPEPAASAAEDSDREPRPEDEYLQHLQRTRHQGIPAPYQMRH